MKRFSAIVLATVALAGCSFQNRYEKEADKVTQAILANDMKPVVGDFDSQARVQITRVRVAQLSDELNGEGKFESVKENPADGPAAPNTHYFDVKFEKDMYEEKIVTDDDGKIREFRVRRKPAAASAP